VLSTAYVLKEQALESIERRHSNEYAFQAALTDWQIAVSDPENHPQWVQFYANALRDALRKVNNRRQETLKQMTVDNWRSVVHREMRADMWYQNVRQDNGPSLSFSHAVEEITTSSNGNSTHPKVSATAV
jgi:hypothetical protein